MVVLLGKLALGLLLFDLLMEWAEFSINLYASIPAHAEAYRAVLFGPYWYVFWIGHVLLGVGVPVVLLTLWPRAPKVVGAAGLLIAATFITVRINLVVPGQVIPELHGLERAFSDLRLNFNYAPSAMEFLVGLFVVAVGIALFYLGYRLLPLTGAQPEPAPAVTPADAQPAVAATAAAGS